MWPYSIVRNYSRCYANVEYRGYYQSAVRQRLECYDYTAATSMLQLS